MYTCAYGSYLVIILLPIKHPERLDPRAKLEKVSYAGLSPRGRPRSQAKSSSSTANIAAAAAALRCHHGAQQALEGGGGQSGVGLLGDM